MKASFQIHLQNASKIILIADMEQFLFVFSIGTFLMKPSKYVESFHFAPFFSPILFTENRLWARKIVFSPRAEEAIKLVEKEEEEKKLCPN